MKKATFLMLMFIGIVSGFMISCNSCKSDKDSQKEIKADSIKEDAPLIVENTISTDREYMFMNYQKDYRWYETCILLNDFLDSEDCNPDSIVGVSSIFQAIKDRGESGYDTEVVMSSHTRTASQIDVVQGFWVEDLPMNEEFMPITFKQAFERVMEANYPKPHSKHVVLRKELGPKSANPQYIFGNVQAQLYVDAVTGDVSDKDPVFEGANLTKPLGEWP